MISYKEYLLASNIGLIINESYDTRRVNFFDLLMEAPIDDATLSKMIASKKGVSIYYQGDEKTNKGWHSVEPIRVDTKGSGKYLLAFVVPKDGSKPVLKYFSQPKIVNWNVLGKKDADLAAQYKKKLVTFFSDPKIPKEKKQSFADSLKKVGVKVTDLVKKTAVAAAIAGTVLMPFKNNIKQYVRQQAPHIAQLFYTKDLNSKDFKEKDLKMMGGLIAKAIEDGQNKSTADSGVVTYNQYRPDIKSDVQSGNMMSFKQLGNQLVQDPEVLVALTLGQFKYKKNSDGSYTITDKYDFSKWKSINTTKKDLEGMSYTAALKKIMDDNDVGIYPAIRHMAYLESPDDVPGTKAKRVAVVIPGSYVTAPDDSADYGTD